MLLLEDLWEGKINPSERGYPKGGEVAKITHEANGYLHEFLKELSSSGKDAFDHYYDKSIDLQSIAERDSFIRGVRIGARFVLDVLGEYRSPMPQTDELH